MEPKKLAPLRILDILREHSDVDHPLTQGQIIHYLEEEYGIEMERKAIGKTISELNEAGFEIEAGHTGCYLLGRTFDDSELKYLIDAVLQSKHISAHHSKDLIDKLCGLSNKYFRYHVKNIYSVDDWNKTENSALFYNIETINLAIAAGRAVVYDYNKYGVDGKLHRTSTQEISPYQLILHNQRYYLMGQSHKHGNLAYHRLDHITNMRESDAAIIPITQIKGYEKGFDYKLLSSALPYMYADKPEPIEMIADVAIVDQIVDWFGKGAKMTADKAGEGKVRVRLTASPKAMVHWAVQYAGYVEVISPLSLRESVKETLQAGLEKYR